MTPSGITFDDDGKWDEIDFAAIDAQVAETYRKMKEKQQREEQHQHQHQQPPPIMPPPQRPQLQAVAVPHIPAPHAPAPVQETGGPGTAIPPHNHHHQARPHPPAASGQQYHDLVARNKALEAAVEQKDGMQSLLQSQVSTLNRQLHELRQAQAGLGAPPLAHAPARAAVPAEEERSRALLRQQQQQDFLEAELQDARRGKEEMRARMERERVGRLQAEQRLRQDAAAAAGGGGGVGVPPQQPQVPAAFQVAGAPGGLLTLGAPLQQGLGQGAPTGEGLRMLQLLTVSMGPTLGGLLALPPPGGEDTAEGKLSLALSRQIPAMGSGQVGVVHVAGSLVAFLDYQARARSLCSLGDGSSTQPPFGDEAAAGRAAAGEVCGGGTLLAVLRLLAAILRAHRGALLHAIQGCGATDGGGGSGAGDSRGGISPMGLGLLATLQNLLLTVAVERAACLEVITLLKLLVANAPLATTSGSGGGGRGAFAPLLRSGTVAVLLSEPACCTIRAAGVELLHHLAQDVEVRGALLEDLVGGPGAGGGGGGGATPPVLEGLIRCLHTACTGCRGAGAGPGSEAATAAAQGAAEGGGRELDGARAGGCRCKEAAGIADAECRGILELQRCSLDLLTFLLAARQAPLLEPLVTGRWRGAPSRDPMTLPLRLLLLMEHLAGGGQGAVGPRSLPEARALALCAQLLRALASDGGPLREATLDELVSQSVVVRLGLNVTGRLSYAEEVEEVAAGAGGAREAGWEEALAATSVACKALHRRIQGGLL